MNIIFAFDKFKGSMTSLEAAEAAKNGIHLACGDIGIDEQTLRYITLPVADGGEGTVEAFLSSLGGKRLMCNVTPPHRHPKKDEEKVQAEYGILPDGTCVIEMAAASGLVLVPKAEQNPLFTSTYGTGEMILHALDHGATRFLIGIGGSATNDGGCGMAAALGARFYDVQGALIENPCGADLQRIARMDLSGMDPRIAACAFTACCDVDNPLCGEHGASSVYGPQKGADADAVRQLDCGLASLAHLWHLSGCEKEGNAPLLTMPGAGAAGGLGAGIVAFLGGTLKSGIDAVLDAADPERYFSDHSLLLTGEGRLDSQTVYGKTVCGLLRRASRSGVDSMVFGGCIEPEAYALYGMGAVGLFALCDRPMTLDDSIKNGRTLLRERVRAAACSYFAGQRAGKSNV